MAILEAAESLGISPLTRSKVNQMDADDQARGGSGGGGNKDKDDDKMIMSFGETLFNIPKETMEKGLKKYNSVKIKSR